MKNKRRGLFWPALGALIVMAVLLRLLSGTAFFVGLARALGPEEAEPPLPEAAVLPEPGAAAAEPAAAEPHLPARESWLSGESALPPGGAALPEDYLPAAGQEALPAGPLLRVNNATSLQPDLQALLAEGWDSRLSRDAPQILILHSHGCEAYAPTPEDPYEESDPSRTLDKAHSVIRVGDALAEALEARGFRVIHDREAYDAQGYSGAYERSRAAAERWLEENPTLRVVIDLHRDALGGYATSWENPAGEHSAQVMLLLSTGENGLYHPHWEENLKLGLALQQEMETSCPGLARPLYLSGARYNQHLSPGFFILEVGSDANTLQEAITAVTAFAGCAAGVLEEYLS